MGHSAAFEPEILEALESTDRLILVAAVTAAGLRGLCKNPGRGGDSDGLRA